MKLSIKIILSAIALSIFVSGVVQAQGGATDATVNAVRRHLEQNDRLIDKARESVHASNVPMAVLALKQAVDLQGRAWERFHGRNYRLAKELAKSAEQNAQKAIAASRRTEENQDAVLRKLERARDLLEKAYSIAGDHQDQGLQNMLESARTNLERAWEFYREQQYRPAWKLANQTEGVAKKILRAAERAGLGESEYERRMEQIQNWLDRADQIIADCDSPKGKQLLEKAKESLQRAQRLAREGRYEPALKALQQAKRLGDQASRDCQGGERIQERLDRLTAQAERLSDQIQPGDGTAERLMATVRDQLRLSAEYITLEQPRSAVASLKAAELSMKQLERYLRTGEI